MRHASVLSIVVLCAFACCTLFAEPPTLRVTATQGPLFLAVDMQDGDVPDGVMRLVEAENGSAKPIAVQRSPAIGDDGTALPGKSRLIAAVPGSGQSPRRLRLLSAATGLAPAPAFQFEEISPASLRLNEGNRPVFVYNHGVVTGEGVPEDDPRHRRSSYIHPVWGLDGEVLSDDFPKDHYHHHGIFWTWPHIRIEDQEYDLWADRGIEQRFVRWIHREAGPVAAILAVENGWFVGDRKVMIERVWTRTFAASGDSQVLDLEFAWIPVDRTITLWGAPGKSYGGLTVRYAPRQDTVITVADGPTQGDLKDTPLAWADFAARFEGRQQFSGAAVFVHPGHPDFPPTWLTRHYGALCVGWPGVKPQSFEAGQILRTSYRILIHRNQMDAQQLQEVSARYVAGVEAVWE